MLGALRRFAPLVAGLLILALTVQLGNWQTRRADEKHALQARIDALAGGEPAVPRADTLGLAEWQPLRVVGTWASGATRLIDNRTHQGRAGYHVVTPLWLEDGSGAVLVNRGWVEAGDRRKLPTVPAAEGVQRIDGWLRLAEEAPFTLSSEADPVSAPVWQHPDPQRHAALLAPARVSSWILQQTSDSADGLVRDWHLPTAGAERHRGYAFQWYSLALLAGGLCVWSVWRLFLRRPHDRHAARYSQS